MMEQTKSLDKEPKEVQLCAATPADAVEIDNIMKDTWRAIYLSPENGVSQQWLDETAETFSSEYIVEKLENNKDNPNHLFILARAPDGQMLGFLQGIKSPDFNELRSIYLSTDQIGKGTGGLLMRHFLNWADSTKPSHLEVASYNKRATGFYERYGFKKTDEKIEKFLGVIPQTRMVRPPIK